MLKNARTVDDEGFTPCIITNQVHPSTSPCQRGVPLGINVIDGVLRALRRHCGLIVKRQLRDGKVKVVQIHKKLRLVGWWPVSSATYLLYVRDTVRGGCGNQGHEKTSRPHFRRRNGGYFVEGAAVNAGVNRRISFPRDAR